MVDIGYEWSMVRLSGQIRRGVGNTDCRDCADLHGFPSGPSSGAGLVGQISEISQISVISVLLSCVAGWNTD